jgi:hypothetical protein
VVRSSDLPAEFTLDPGETHGIALQSVLADPFSAGTADVVRRERVAGYQATFRSPESGTVQCSATVYRSAAGADDVSQRRTRLFAVFVVHRGGRARRVGSIGDEAHAYSYPWSSGRGLTITWRDDNILASCISVTPGGDLALLTRIALAQQARISKAGGD